MTLLALRILLTAALAADPRPPVASDPLLTVVRDREAEILTRLQAAFPLRYEELVALRARDPSAYLDALLRIDRDPERGLPPAALRDVLAEAAALRARLPTDLAALPEADQAQLRADLTQLAGRIFTLKQAERRRRLAELEEGLTRLRAEISDRDAQRDALIAAWVERVLRGEAPN
jgi:hypothetical protein